MQTASPTTFLLWCGGSFLAGSIPFGLLLFRLAGKGDVRRQGSGNIGATNVLRSGGKGLGVATLVLDVAKGFLPVLLTKLFRLPADLQALAALAAVLGHVFTPWLRCKGGKGVATALGVALAYHAPMVLPSLGAFLVLVLGFRYISLGSIVAAGVLILSSLGVFGAWVCPRGPAASVLAWGLIAILVIAKHGANIQRLVQGRESKLWGGSNHA